MNTKQYIALVSNSLLVFAITTQFLVHVSAQSCPAGSGCTDTLGIVHVAGGQCIHYEDEINDYCEEEEVCNLCACACSNRCPTECITCGVGKYKSSNTYEGCLDCPVGTTSMAGSTDASNCEGVCTAGHTRVDGVCTKCAPGTFKVTAGEEECEQCPTNAQSNPAIGGATMCTCKTGYTKIGAACELCSSTTWKNTPGDFACSGCGLNSVAIPDRTSCVCVSGATGPFGSCTLCPKGTFKINEGSDSCTKCLANYYSSQTGATSDMCEACATGGTSPEGSTDVTACIFPCDAGYTLLNGACTQCVAGTYKNDIGDSDCMQCVANSVSPVGSNSSIACLCDLGYTGPNGGACSACVAGKYKNVLGEEECTQCPAFSTTPSASTTIVSCTCVAGYTKSSDNSCVPCASGTFKKGEGNAECDNCPLGSTSQPGSTVASNCLCKAGYSGYVTESTVSNCVACESGMYKTSVGTGTCESNPLYAYVSAKISAINVLNEVSGKFPGVFEDIIMHDLIIMSKDMVEYTLTVFSITIDKSIIQQLEIWMSGIIDNTEINIEVVVETIPANLNSARRLLQDTKISQEITFVFSEVAKSDIISILMQNLVIVVPVLCLIILFQICLFMFIRKYYCIHNDSQPGTYEGHLVGVYTHLRQHH